MRVSVVLRRAEPVRAEEDSMISRYNRVGGQDKHAPHTHLPIPAKPAQLCRKHLTKPARLATNPRAMNSDTPDSLIPYDEIVQEALRAVVGRVLGSIVSGGGMLPGAHHFYITFKTAAPGVMIPPQLHERFPDEMTIVLQNKFWDLEVSAQGFSVGLTFNQVPAKLSIPFSAITAFVDPAVDFGLQFQTAADEFAPETHENAENDGTDPDGDGDGSNVVSVDFGRKK